MIDEKKKNYKRYIKKRCINIKRDHLLDTKKIL